MRSVAVMKSSLVGLISLIVLFAAGCGGSRITSANFDKIQDGMSRASVESILGPGKIGATSSATVPGFSGGVISVAEQSMSGESLIWQEGNKIITVMFLNGKVMGKAANGL